MLLEERFVKIKLQEDDHLINIFNSSLYRGWYLHKLDTEECGKKFKDIVVRFRIPPTIPLYQGVLRNFNEDERMIGVHRLLTGKDLKEETELLLNFDNIENYVKTLKDDKVKELLGRMKNMVTFDCNKISYLHIRLNAEDPHDDKTDDTIKKFIVKHPDYLRMLYDVLNENISISEVTLLSKNVIYNELEELNSK